MPCSKRKNWQKHWHSNHRSKIVYTVNTHTHLINTYRSVPKEPSLQALKRTGQFWTHTHQFRRDIIEAFKKRQARNFGARGHLNWTVELLQSKGNFNQSFSKIRILSWETGYLASISITSSPTETKSSDQFKDLHKPRLLTKFHDNPTLPLKVVPKWKSVLRCGQCSCTR